MNQEQIDRLRYPIGKYAKPDGFSRNVVTKSTDVIARYPSLVRSEVSALSKEELMYTYRPGGWNIAQVVHHTADSHMNAFIRFKLALTESTPTIKPYLEDLWAKLPDTTRAPVEASLNILDGLHLRWSTLLQTLTEEDLHKKYFHPEQKKEVALFEVLVLYAWHCRHHLAHVQQAKKYRGKFLEKEN